MGKAVAALLLMVAAVARAGAAPDATPSGPRRTVVALYSISQEVAGLHELSLAVNEGIRRGSPVPTDVYSEYTGLDRFPAEAYAEALRTMLQEKYHSRKIDLLVLVGPTALEFVVSKNLFPGVPIVTCYVAGRLVDAARRSRPELTGALPAQNAPRTLELMLQLYPGTRRIYVVLGGSAYERGQADQGKALFASFASRVEVTYTSDLTLDQLDALVRQLPESDLVLWGSLLQDGSGRDFDTTEPLTRISAASRRPVFGVIYEDLGAGILGGELVSMGTSGQVAAQLAVRVLGGEPASSIPPVVDAGLAPMFDARQLTRWRLSERALPPGSRILFRLPSLLEEHAREIGLALGIIALESLLVAGLIIQLRRRLRIERALATAETRYRTVADFTHDWEFWRHPDGTFEYMSPACERVSGHAAGDFLADPGLLDRLVHEEDVEIWHRAVSATAPQPPVEFRIHTRQGELRWVRFASNPVRLPDGTAAGLRGSLADVTSRKLGELALEQAYREIAALKDRLEAENTYYREKIQAVEPSGDLLGQSDAMKYLHFRIRQVAPSDTTVLILGETGTGKELVAEEIHALGPRKSRPLVKVNCAALPPTLAESELFGHEKGAFTGSMAQRKGRFELADGATLFLDEVGELTPELQAKLLRVLQDGTFERVGGDRTLKVDVRVIAATNRALSRDVVAGRFREDLWYRLNVFPISVPPLRQRKDDIPTLALAFVDRACERLGRPAPEIPQSVILALQAREWPGNVRELQNTIEQAVLVSDGGHLRLADHLPSEAPVPAAPAPRSLEEVERRHILEMLEAANWKLEGANGAAALLGLKPSTLRSRMQKLDIRRPAGA